MAGARPCGRDTPRYVPGPYPDVPHGENPGLIYTVNLAQDPAIPEPSAHAHLYQYFSGGKQGRFSGEATSLPAIRVAMAFPPTSPAVTQRVLRIIPSGLHGCLAQAQRLASKYQVKQAVGVVTHAGVTGRSYDFIITR